MSISRRLGAALVLALVSASVPAYAEIPAPARPAFCHPGPIDAGELPERIPLRDCDIVGRTITAGPLSLQVPPPGVGRELAGLVSDGELYLAARTTLDGIVEVETTDTREAAFVAAAAPGNETIATATPITLPWDIPNGTTVGATQDQDDMDANVACGLGSVELNNSVWYSLSVGSTTEVVTELTSASAFPPVLQVFTGTAGNLTPVICDGTDFAAQAGTTYLLRVGTYDEATFDFAGHAMTAADRPANDLFGSAETLAVPDTTTVADMQRATRQASEPAGTCGDGSGTVWYRLQPGQQRRVRLGSDDAFAVYRGSSLGALTQLACSRSNTTPTLVTLPSTGTFYVQMWDRLDEGTLDLETTSGEPAPDSPAPCASTAGAVEPNTNPRAKWRWSINNANAPANLGALKSLGAVKTGMRVITESRNDCGMDDRVSAATEYLGATSRTASLCTGQQVADKRNVIDFGSLSGFLGLACSETTATSMAGPWTVVETDLRFNKATRWTLTPDAKSCNDRYDLLGVAAHETGHAFGLKHAPGVGGANQTMAASAVSCNGGARTLGRGDVLMLRDRY